MNRQLKHEYDGWDGGNMYYKYSVKCESVLHFFSIGSYSFATKRYDYDKTDLKRQLAMTGKWRIINHEDGNSTLVIEFASEYKTTTFDRVQSWFEKLFRMKGTYIDTENFTTEDVVDKFWIREENIIVEELYDNECTCNTTE